MKLITLKITVVLVGMIFIGGCTNIPEEKSLLNFDYTVTPKSTNLIRAFDNQKDTLLQFSNIDDASPIITGKNKRNLKYSKIGHYVVVPGIHNILHIKMEDGSNTVARLNLR